jgi:tRNA threonylcarbamoyladenosine biosynthesis protein TsaE
MKILGLAEMYAEAARLIETLAPRSDGATIITLSGDLGAGKTTFAQGIARALGVEESVTSPTFVLEKIYELEERKWLHLIHIDAYRINDPHELEVLGWNEIIAEPSNLILIEWPEHVVALIPSHAVRVSLDSAGDSTGNSREIVYHTELI